MFWSTGPPRWWQEIDDELRACAVRTAKMVDVIRRLRGGEAPQHPFHPAAGRRYLRRSRPLVIVIEEATTEDSPDKK